MDATLPSCLARLAGLVMGLALSSVAPQGRTARSADALGRLVRTGVATLPEQRAADAAMVFPDALMAACALCARTSPSLLALATERVAGHVHTGYGLERGPCDTRRRAILAPVSPQGLRPGCKSGGRQRPRGPARAPRVLRDGHACLALAGTGEVAAPTRHGASCLHKGPRHGSRTSAHSM